MNNGLLHWALVVCFLSNVSILRGERTDPPAPAKDETDMGVALVNAAREGDMQALERIVRTRPKVVNAQPFTSDKGRESHFNEWSALHWAVRRNDYTMAEFLVKHGADPNGKEPCKHRPLGIAADERMGKLLVAAGADVTAEDRLGHTPLDEIRDATVARLLIAKGAKVEGRENLTNQTPLLRAARDDRGDVARVLVEHKANVNAKDCVGITPLHNACRSGSLLMARLLVEHGADMFARDVDGSTPVWYAAGGGCDDNPAERQHADVIDLLAKRGVSLQAKDSGGMTLLHLAAAATYLDVAKYLLRNGLDVNARMQNGLTPLHLAAQMRGGGWGFASDGTREVALVKLLLEHRANVHAEALADIDDSTDRLIRYTTKKVTPLSYAMVVARPVPAQCVDPREIQENVDRTNRTRKVIADLLRQHGAK